MQYDIKEDLTLLTWRMSDPKMFINRICTLYSTGWFAGKQAATWFPAYQAFPFAIPVKI